MIRKISLHIKYFICISLAIFFMPAILLQNEVDENDLVIAYLERFTRFISNDKFPDFDNNDIPFNIYVYGKNPFGRNLDDAYKNQKIKNRIVQIQYVDNIEKIKNANLIYINVTSKREIEKLVEFANQMGILTISYSKGFAEKGIHINLYQKDNRLKFEINLKSAQAAGFSISHLLLSNSKIVESSNE